MQEMYYPTPQPEAGGDRQHVGSLVDTGGSKWMSSLLREQDNRASTENEGLTI